MRIYQSKYEKLSGTNFSEVLKKANTMYAEIKSKTKRRPYVRSAYFNKQKILVGTFFGHVHEKNWRDAVRRLKLFPCAVDLIKNSRFEPVSKQDPGNPNEILHRFAGATRSKELYYVQIKENKQSGEKILLSVCPEQ